MDKNPKELSGQAFKKHNNAASFYYTPSPKYPKPCTRLYTLAYVATRELERLEKNEEKELIDIGQIKPSLFQRYVKKLKLL